MIARTAKTHMMMVSTRLIWGGIGIALTSITSSQATRTITTTAMRSEIMLFSFQGVHVKQRLSVRSRVPSRYAHRRYFEPKNLVTCNQIRRNK